ncbi:MAG: ATP-grasp domain-containing protein [candidate division KSB1 bacterium]|nr:ATP-grasp domain-containing protein [candidate division KSB1 bacterium]
MRIGLTYDLRQEYLDMGFGEEETAEFDSEMTIAAIESTLQDLGHETVRIGRLGELMRRILAGERWDLVFNIAEGLYGIGREAQVPALLDAFGIPYTFSDPLVMALTLHKGMTKRVLRDLGLPTPNFCEITAAAEIQSVHLTYPLFAKPIAEGTGKGISAASKILDARQLEEVCLRLLRDFRQAVLVEEFLPGREFTVGIAGTGADARVLGVMEVLFQQGAENDAYGYGNKKDWVDRVRYVQADDTAAKQAAETALAAWRGLGCRDAGRIDMRLDRNGIPNLIEINPLAGLRPEYSDLPLLCSLHGISYRELIAMILESAAKRMSAAGGFA